MFDTGLAVSALAPSEVELRTREAGALPPTWTGRPSIPLILFAIAHSPRDIYEPVNGASFRNFRPVDEKLALSGQVRVTQVRMSPTHQGFTRTTPAVSATPSIIFSESRFLTRTRCSAAASAMATPGARTSRPPARAMRATL